MYKVQRTFFIPLKKTKDEDVKDLLAIHNRENYS